MKHINKDCIKTAVFISLIVVLLVISGCTGASTTATVSSPVELNVCAGVGLTDVLTEINTLYMQEYKNVTIVANFAAAGILQTQIEQGAPGDVIIMPGAKQMDALQKGELIINDTRQNLLKNKVVLVVPSGSALTISSFTDLLNDEVKKIAIGDPEFVPAGTYGIQVFDIFGITEQLQPKLLICSDVRQVLTYVEAGNVDAGIVYATDAAITANVKIAVEAPDEVNNKVIFGIAVIKATKNADAAKAYIAFLAGSEAKTIFEKYGFVVVVK